MLTDHRRRDHLSPPSRHHPNTTRLPHILRLSCPPPPPPPPPPSSSLFPLPSSLPLSFPPSLLPHELRHSNVVKQILLVNAHCTPSILYPPPPISSPQLVSHRLASPHLTSPRPT
ncbi:unnamed protein product [Hydatigera taeniaeformis]|uniref:Uncharacterized protein n=1 Tax=Hydatigena taeniaeformis TaxID=6205 RepID=A0A0R3X015_HYDTA|nr:unnamed protein product [Hydatigera taeniaeformis]